MTEDFRRSLNLSQNYSCVHRIDRDSRQRGLHLVERKRPVISSCPKFGSFAVVSVFGEKTWTYLGSRGRNNDKANWSLAATLVTSLSTL